MCIAMYILYNDAAGIDWRLINQAEPALVYDSVMALAHGLAALDRGTSLRLANLSCDVDQPWNDGSSLFNYINTVRCASYCPRYFPPFVCVFSLSLL